MTETVTTADTPPPATPAHEDRTLPVIVYVLYLLGLTHFGLTTLLGVIIAYVARDGAGPVARSHYDLLIRTFWPFVIGLLITMAIGAIGVLLMVVLIGFPIILGAIFLFCALMIWVLVRCVVGLIHLSRGEAYPRPGTWLA